MARILIVDDNAATREILEAFLEETSHEVESVDSGEKALEIAAKRRPDLVLLDVMMPVMDGFQTTRLLKELAGEEFLPIILATALDDRESRVTALRMGADGFLTKPIDRVELKLRIANLLALRSKDQSLALRNVELLGQQRAREELAELLVHDLKNPCAVVLANLEYVLNPHPGETEEGRREALLDSQKAAQRALRLLSNLLDTTRAESGRLQLRLASTPIAAVVGPVLHERLHMARARDITMRSQVLPSATARVDVDVLTRVVENIFDNAMRYTPPGGLIEVRAEPRENALALLIGNSGPPVPEEARTHIFEKFWQGADERRRHNAGLGLYFCRLAAEAHGGRIWIEQTTELPTIFGIEIPN